MFQSSLFGDLGTLILVATILREDVTDDIFSSWKRRLKYLANFSYIIHVINCYHHGLYQIPTMYSLNILQFYLSILPQWSWKRKKRYLNGESLKWWNFHLCFKILIPLFISKCYVLAFKYCVIFVTESK